MQTEYVIWGKAPGAGDESLLIVAPAGQAITDKNEADRFCGILATQHGCTGLRIQTLDGTLPNFAGTVR